MKLDWLCEEKLTAVSLGCAGLMLADGGLISGGVIAGAGLLGMWNKARRADGVNSEKLLAEVRKQVRADFERWAAGESLSEADLRAADKAMAEHLHECVPPVDDLAKTTFHSEDFPAFAALLVVDRLAQRNPIFSIDHPARSPVAREFALLVVKGALTKAKEQAPFMQRLTQEVVLLLPQHLVRLEGKVDGIAQGQAEQSAQLDRIEAILLGQVSMPPNVLRETVQAELAAQPGATDADLAAAVRSFKAEHDRLANQLALLVVFDNHIADLKAQASEALEAYDHTKVATLYAQMREITDERNLEGLHRSAEFAQGEAQALMLARDWQGAHDVWVDAASKLAPFAHVEAESLLESAAVELLNFARLYGGGALVEAISLLRPLAYPEAFGGTDQVRALRQGLLGNALQAQGAKLGGVEGNSLLVESLEAYRDSLEVFNRIDLPVEWAGMQNDIGNVLRTQGERLSDEKGIELLGQAVDAYHAALEVLTRIDMPQDWAMTQNNLGNTLRLKGSRLSGDVGTALLGKAVHAYHAALEVRTRGDMPEDWAITMNSLGNALRLQGVRLYGDAGTALLRQAVDAFQVALEVCTRPKMPLNWAMIQNNLGAALQTQAARFSGDAGIALLSEAVEAYRLSLQVRIHHELPVEWAMTHENIGHAEEALGHLTSGSKQIAHLRSAEESFSLALNVYDPKHMAFYHIKCTTALTRVRAKLASLT